LKPPGINHDVFLGMHKINGSKENKFWLIALQMASDLNTDFYTSKQTYRFEIIERLMITR
jgi:hypothetical protein